MDMKYFEYNNRLWKRFVDFFKNVKGYTDWSEKDIWESMNNDDIKEFVEYYHKEFNLEQRKETLKSLLDMEYIMRKEGTGTTQQKKEIKKAINNTMADIADYMLFFN